MCLNVEDSFTVVVQTGRRSGPQWHRCMWWSQRQWTTQRATEPGERRRWPPGNPPEPTPCWSTTQSVESKISTGAQTTEKRRAFIIICQCLPWPSYSSCAHCSCILLTRVHYTLNHTLHLCLIHHFLPCTLQSLPLSLTSALSSTQQYWKYITSRLLVMTLIKP